jgi:hypothetical protein
MTMQATHGISALGLGHQARHRDLLPTSGGDFDARRVQSLARPVAYVLRAIAHALTLG